VFFLPPTDTGCLVIYPRSSDDTRWSDSAVHLFCLTMHRL